MKTTEHLEQAYRMTLGPKNNEFDLKGVLETELLRRQSLVVAQNQPLV